ncbi:MAG: PBP1A family penicillin-binding protein [Thermodesulfobacteriota bacterium]|nr:MAG: PBP1A family penicillin-binding protein [Thermodesulfobacteriota bacterium]
MAKKSGWTLFWIAVSGVIVFVIGLCLYCWSLSSQIEKRFSGRRWSIPSKVFSDITVLYPGQTINRELFFSKLYRLGYRKVSHNPTQKGEFCASGSGIALFLHDFEIPSQKQEGFPVQVKFSENIIIGISRLATGEPVPILELEPEEIMSFFGPEREKRQLVSLKQVPRYLIDGIIVTEDNRFYHHHGVDPLGIVRAMLTNMRHLALRQGGSTITQQLAKNYFLTPAKTISRKVKELLISINIEIRYSKDEILEIYLNEIYLGQKGSVSINGVGEASNFYFSKPVSELSLAESALIAGLIRAPNYYSPYTDKNRCQERRNLVLQAMFKQGFISDQELKTSSAKPVTVTGFMVYANKAPYFIDYLADQLKLLYPPETLSNLGLSLYTTLDTQVQAAAERALANGLSRLEKSYPQLRRSEPEKKLQGALIVMQPNTGYILALVGGRNYNQTQFNRTTQSRRQPGSAFKPFVYLSALDSFTPVSILSNAPKTYVVDGKKWKPQNYEPDSEERITVRKALAKSLNIATVDLAMQVGLARIVDTAKAFQFSTPVKPYPSLALGAFETIPIELARAYCALAADGVLPHPLSLKEVVDEKGQVLERRQMTIKRVTSPAKAFLMSSLLRSVITEGTARSLLTKGVTFPVAGKTGTTNDYKDAWFVGYTPDILVLVWVGFDNGDSIHVAGATAALPIWAELVNSIPEYISGQWFKMPSGVVKRIVCSESGQIAVSDVCPEPREEFFLAENAPADYCSVHRHMGLLDKIMKGMKDVIE